jgi:hypothetical protein
VRSSETFHAILISADPSANMSESQIRSWLMWQETECGRSRSMMFGDSNRVGAEWINGVAKSIDFLSDVETNDLAAKDYSTMPDDEILTMLKTECSNQPEAQPGRTMP